MARRTHTDRTTAWLESLPPDELLAVLDTVYLHVINVAKWVRRMDRHPDTQHHVRYGKRSTRRGALQRELKLSARNPAPFRRVLEQLPISAEAPTAVGTLLSACRRLGLLLGFHRGLALRSRHTALGTEWYVSYAYDLDTDVLTLPTDPEGTT